MESRKILVVEDELSVRELIEDALNMSGFSVTTAGDGLEALNLLRNYQFDLLVTDVTMPKLDGYELVKNLRSKGNETPVIFLTARNEKPDISTGFKVGADDYISKPFGLEELIFRITAILKRVRPSAARNVLTCGPIHLNNETHLVTFNEVAISLSPTEFRLLEILMENKNKVLTKHALLDHVWDMGFSESTAVVDTFISYLRKKLHKSGFSGIVTVRGIGFKITDHQ